MYCRPHHFLVPASTHYHTPAWQTLIHRKECFILFLKDENTFLKSSASSNFLPLHRRDPAIVGLFRIHLHVFLMSFKRQNGVTPSHDMTDIILELQLTSASAHFPRTFKTVTLLFHITLSLSFGYIGEVCSN